MTMRLREPRGPCRVAPARKNCHISCIGEYTGAAGDPGTAGKAEMNTTAHTHDTMTPAARPSGAAGGCREHPAVPAGHRRAPARRRALGRPVRPARRRAAAGGRPAARADGAVAPGRVRGHRATRARPGMVLADPGRDDRDRAGVPGHPARAGPPRAPAGDPGRPAVDAIEPGLAAGPGLVAFRAAAARRAARGRPQRARRRRGDPLAVDRGQPVRGAGVGDRGRAHPETSRADHPDHDRAAGAHVVRAGDLPDRPESPPVVTRAAGSLPPGDQARVVVRDLPGYAFTPEQHR